MEYLSDALNIMEAILAVIGGLKILARYTKTEADDKILAAIESPMKKFLSFLPKKK